jgi:uncharacterized protein
LQEIDIALDTRRASIEDARARLGETDELREARQRVADLTAALRKTEADQKDIALQAEELREKIKPLEEKLYSGSIRQPKELADLQADIDQVKRQFSTVEDRELEALSSVEAAEEALSGATADLDAIEKAWREEQAELTQRVESQTAEVAEYERQREEAAGDIDAGLLANYDQIRRRHQGRGVARLDRNLCTGCRISLPTNVVNRARAGTALEQCPNCERILYA